MFIFVQIRRWSHRATIRQIRRASHLREHELSVGARICTTTSHLKLFLKSVSAVRSIALVNSKVSRLILWTKHSAFSPVKKSKTQVLETSVFEIVSIASLFSLLLAK